MKADIKIIEQKYEEVNRLNLALNKKINQLLAVKDTGKAILSVLKLEEVLAIIMNLLSSGCRIDRAIIMLVNKEKGCLEYLYGVGFDDEIPEDVRNYTVPLHRVSNILAGVTSTGRPEYVPEMKSTSLNKEDIMLARVKPSSVEIQ